MLEQLQREEKLLALLTKEEKALVWARYKKEEIPKELARKQAQVVKLQTEIATLASKQ